MPESGREILFRVILYLMDRRVEETSDYANPKRKTNCNNLFDAEMLIQRKINEFYLN